MEENALSRWRRRVLLFAAAVALGLLVARMFDPHAGELAAEDDVETLVRDASRKPAPELDGASAWINTDKPLAMADLKGKVVLLDFWTFG